MKIDSFQQSILTNIKGRNQNKLFPQKLSLKKKSKTISMLRKTPPTSRTIRPFPILSFPLSNNKEKSFSPFSLFSTSNFFYNPLSQKKQKTFNTLFLDSSSILNSPKIFNNNKYIRKISQISHSSFSRPFSIIKKELITSKKLKRINILDFGNNLKLYSPYEKKHKNKSILEKRKKQFDELYYDYDKKNKKIILNSFSGNRADLLKNKIYFVKGIVDYLYPKVIIKKMDILTEIKHKRYDKEIAKLEANPKKKFFTLKHKSPDQKAAISKYLYEKELETIKPNKNLIKSKKNLINKKIVSKLLKLYDFI